MPQNKIIFLIGPTAVGKTEIAIALAKKLNGEIISCDSMQVYKEVSIASNKPSHKQLREIPHHLIGHVLVAKSFDAASFRKQATTVLAKIFRKNKVPIIAGGSGLYMQVLLDGVFEGLRADVKVRKKLEEFAAQKGADALYHKLKECDSAAAAKIHPHDRRRLIRALEVFELKQQPISQLQKIRQGLWGHYDIHIFALNRHREELYQRINERVEKMFEHGIINEIKILLKKKLSPTAGSMIGLKEIGGYLRLEYDLPRAKYLLQRNTRHFAKRQLTWFRKDKRLHWIMILPNDTAETIVNEIVGDLAS